MMSVISKIPLHAIWLAQDDPKKNTAVKLGKRNQIYLHKNFNKKLSYGAEKSSKSIRIFKIRYYGILQNKQIW